MLAVNPVAGAALAAKHENEGLLVVPYLAANSVHARGARRTPNRINAPATNSLHKQDRRRWKFTWAPPRGQDVPRDTSAGVEGLEELRSIASSGTVTGDLSSPLGGTSRTRCPAVPPRRAMSPYRSNLSFRLPSSPYRHVNAW